MTKIIKIIVWVTYERFYHYQINWNIIDNLLKMYILCKLFYSESVIYKRFFYFSYSWYHYWYQVLWLQQLRTVLKRDMLGRCLNLDIKNPFSTFRLRLRLRHHRLVERILKIKDTIMIERSTPNVALMCIFQQ